MPPSGLRKYQKYADEIGCRRSPILPREMQAAIEDFAADARLEHLRCVAALD